jgi:hypothetical protein
MNDYENPQIVDGYSNEEIKVLRGGSFFYDKSDATCMYRARYAPYGDDDGYDGLRVVVATSITTPPSSVLVSDS